VIRGPSGGGVRGGPFHSQNPEMAFFHTPGLKIVYPATAYDAKGLIKAAIRDDDPVLFFEHKWLYRLPLDEGAIVRSVKKTNRLLIVHEDTRTGGIAGEISMRINEKAWEWLDAPILRVTAIDAPVPYSPPLEDFFLPQPDDIVKAARYLAAY